jgi:sugar phosphate isomerase/epimerase
LPESITVKHAAKALKDAGLKVLGMHTALPVGKQRDQVLRMAEAYDSRRVIYPGGPPEHRSTIEDTVKYMVEVYNETAGFFKTKGLEFGLHNHWWEFENTDGVYPFYYLLENLDASVFFELDTYWIKTAGFDPARAVKDFGRRAPLLHIKDGPAVKGSTADRQVPVGAGSMDFPAIVAAGGENIEWMIVEFDEYEKDIFDGIRQSYSFLTKRGLAAGKI